LQKQAILEDEQIARVSTHCAACRQHKQGVNNEVTPKKNMNQHAETFSFGVLLHCFVLLATWSLA